MPDPIGTDPSTVPADPAPTVDATSSLNPVVLTLLRYVVTTAATALASRTGIDALNDPTVVNVSITVVASLLAVGMAWWAANSATVMHRIGDLVKRGDIHSIHASPAIVAAAADPKVKAP